MVVRPIARNPLVASMDFNSSKQSVLYLSFKSPGTHCKKKNLQKDIIWIKFKLSNIYPIFDSEATYQAEVWEWQLKRCFIFVLAMEYHAGMVTQTAFLFLVMGCIG
jgi:hypothetical protein